MPKDNAIGAQLTLRAPHPSDIEVHAALPHSPEIHVMYGGDPDFPAMATRARSEGWFKWLSAHEYARIIEIDHRVAGEIRLHNVDEEERTARLAVGFFRESDLGRGYGRRAIVQALAHGFTEMGLAVIDLRVLDFNTRAIRCYQHCGFETVARLPRALRVAGLWHDDLLMEITAERFSETRNLPA